MIYFTADLHFYHENIIKLTGRPYRNAEQMNQSLVSNWNSIITPADKVYILGDVTMKGAAPAMDILTKLKGRKYLVKGNHDHFVGKSDFDKSIFEQISDYAEITFETTRFILMHYPIMDWNGMFRGSMMLHGHQHNHPSYNEENRRKGILRYDVGVDANDMKPVSAEAIVRFFHQS